LTEHEEICSGKHRIAITPDIWRRQEGFAGRFCKASYILRRNQMSDEPRKDEQAPEVKTELSGQSLPEKELEQVAGGVDNAGFTVMKELDKSTPKL
jgi:hypothetical protein